MLLKQEEIAIRKFKITLFCASLVFIYSYVSNQHDQYLVEKKKQRYAEPIKAPKVKIERTDNQLAEQVRH